VAELFDYVGEDVLLWMKDKAGHYQWVNVAFVLNFGLRSRAEVIGRTDFDLCSLALANQYRSTTSACSWEADPRPYRRISRCDHTARWCVTRRSRCATRRAASWGPRDHHPRPDRSSPPPTAPEPAIRFLSEHYAESIANEDVAAACGSVRAFEQFRAEYNMSPHEYIRELWCA
jgi:hypothetical protein